ncbi:hypothetical protein FBALC1_04397 [Flavobacteriales bacterium ALC-1]|nr:hypothetical protein FBALC1_04397 [Flavobacteriales bacterium ALC-1]
MIHLIWSTLNTIAAIYFLYLIIGFLIKGKRIFKPQTKKFSIFVMVLGIVQIISASKSDKSTNRITINEGYDKINNSKIETLLLEDNLTLDINMHITYIDNENQLIPKESVSFLTGFVSGYAWELESIETKSRKPNEKAKFTATGILKWKLFGINVYNQKKTFNGIIN